MGFWQNKGFYAVLDHFRPFSVTQQLLVVTLMNKKKTLKKKALRSTSFQIPACQRLDKQNKEMLLSYIG